MLYDKNAATNLLGCLISNPDFLAQEDLFPLSMDDFHDRFHKLVFSGMYNIYHNGLAKITVQDFDAYLRDYPDQYKFYNDKNGADAFLAFANNAQVENISYYHNRVRKFSLLRSLQPNFDISEWWSDEIIEFEKRSAMMLKFDSASIKDILH